MAKNHLKLVGSKEQILAFLKPSKLSDFCPSVNEPLGIRFWAFMLIFIMLSGIDLTVVKHHCIHYIYPFSFFQNKWRSITCKHNARWLQVSRLKASAVYYFQKIFNLSKRCRLKPEKGAGIWWVMEPHWIKIPDFFKILQNKKLGMIWKKLKCVLI